MRVVLFLFLGVLISCSQADNAVAPSIRTGLSITGEWRFSMQLGESELPFNAILKEDGPNLVFILINDKEEIITKEIRETKDSLKISLPYFQSVLECKIESPDFISGHWKNLNKDNYSIPLIAEKGKSFRFTSTKSSAKIPNRYRVEFGYDEDSPWDAVLLLNNSQGNLSGTFLTETGDFRFLEGNIMNGRIYLSTFDGSHAFLFEAEIAGDSLIDGVFKSGKHYKTSWKAKADKSFELPSPTSLTYLKKGYEYIDFELPNQDKEMVTWSDLNLDNKVVILDIMGSWCPNCLDAAVAIDSLISLYPDDEIELVTIAFELTKDFDIAKKRIIKMQSELGLDQKFLFAGLAKKEEAVKKLPMLNHIMSYPTLIFIGKDRSIAQIYTGFYGPGTGSHYDQFMMETKDLLDSLLSSETKLARN